MKKIIIGLTLLFISSIAFNQTIVEKTITIKSQKNVNLDFDFADEEEYYEPKRRSHGGKTKRNKKGSGTKRRY